MSIGELYPIVNLIITDNEHMLVVFLLSNMLYVGWL